MIAGSHHPSSLEEGEDSMPKARQTCTQCSLRRQKCDRKQPCDRCVKRGIAERCTIQWTATPVAHGSLPSEFHFEIDDTFVTPTVAAPQGDVLSSSIRDIAIPPSTTSTARIFQGWNPQLGSIDTLNSQLQFLQILMPGLDQIQSLVNYAEKRVLWYHGCYHGPTFNAELQKRLSAPLARTNDTLILQANDLQWTALFFAIISGALTCASPQAARSMGFEESESQTLSKQWHRASTSCLEMAGYRAKHSIHAVQAIATLTMCAHTLGRSSEQHVLMGSAIHLARCLKLHRLKVGNEEVNRSSSPEMRRSVLNKEVGRRLFCQLCVQDWFSIPFAGAHSIHRGDFTTVKPRDRDYITMEPLPVGEPNYVSYNNYLYDIAALTALLHESVARCNTDFTRYEKVLEIDSRMRELATRDRPRYFDVTVPIDPSWPWFVPWARRSLTICFAHKMIIIHKSFLSKSSNSGPFDYSRRTSIAAAKTILNEASQPRQVEEPVIWIDQAFCIAAGITLLVDTINHTTVEQSERDTSQSLGERCLLILDGYQHSLLALRGTRLLLLLLNFVTNPVEAREYFDTSKSAYDILRYVYDGSIEGRLAGISSLADAPIQDIVVEDKLDAETDVVPELFPAQVGFSNEFIFQDLLGFESLARLSVVR